MPVYEYKVKNDAGRIFKGKSKVASRDQLLVLLGEKGFEAFEIKEINAFTDISQIKLLKAKIKVKDLAVFCRQFAIVLEAGIPMGTGLDVLREQTQNPTLKEVVADIYENVQKGMSLSNAMKKHADVFPEILVSMVEAGELSGQLDRVFVRMADHFEKEFKLNHKVKSALTFPVILCVVASLVIAVLMLKVIPTFAGVLDDMGSELPIFTKILVAISSFFKNFWWLIILGLGVLVFGLKSYAATQEGKRTLGSLALKLPVIKDVTRIILTARFTRTLGTLITSGVLMLTAMEVSKKVVGNEVIKNKMENAIEEVKKGKSLTQAIQGMKYFPPLVVSMVRIGEESGSLDFSLNKASDFYDQEVETAMQRLVSLLEPIIMVLMGAVVAFIIFSIMYPMISVYQNMAASA
jgi:type IV pilus assembly protein PilC